MPTDDVAIHPLQFSVTNYGSEKEGAVAYFASSLLDVALTHSNKDKADLRINDTGWAVLMDLFGAVPESMRADVFTAFLACLMAGGYQFDKLQFQNGPAA